MKKALAILLLTVLLVSVSGSCGSGNEQNAASVQQETPAAPVFDQEREITVTLAQTETDPERTALLRLIADKFEYDNPNITIVIQTLSKDPAEGKKQIQTGGIDLFEVDQNTLSQYAKAGLLTDLGGYMSNWDENSTLSSVSKNICKAYDAAPYFIVHSIYTKALYFRKDWLKEQGHEAAPRYYDTWYEVAALFTDPDAGRYGLVMGGRDAAAALGDTMIWSTAGKQNIANIFAGYFVQDSSEQTVFSLPQAQLALEQYQSLYQDAMPAEVLNWTQEQAAESFSKGEAAMLVADSRVIPLLNETLEDDQWSIARLPQGPEKIGIQSTEFSGWALAENSAEQDAAAAFLLYLSNTDNSTKWARELNAFPTHTDATIAEDYFNSTQFSGFVDLFEKVSVGSYYFAERPLLYDAAIGYAAKANAWYADFLSGKESAASLLQELDSYWTAAYRQEGQLWKSKVVATPAPGADS